ncbi:response regulator transcription factor [Christensenellaceae bacterium OttesenSCG-928-M15]|nr:response regulator transcription factor [Christensenellaceae bacterium OttesenSCG-928-M15]
MKLLIIEDEIDLAALMKKGMEEKQFTVDLAHDGAGGEQYATLNAYDAILLDLNLPDMDGMEVLKSIRTQGVDTPVIIVSARNTAKQKSEALDLGADDFLVKPFDFLELTSRIYAVTRRFYGRTNPSIAIGSLLINPATRQVQFCGHEMDFSAKEFEILFYIAKRYPEIVSAEELIEHVYDEELDPFSSVLRVHFVNMRKKFKRISPEPVFETVKSKGYRIVCGSKQE